MRKALIPLIMATCLAAGPIDAKSQEKPDPKGEATLAKLLAGRTAGQPVDCISLTSTNNSQIVDGTAIVYDFGRTIYVNRPTSGASTLDSNDILVTKSWGSQLCSLDTVRLIDRGTLFPRNFIPLGKFVPYTKPKAG